MGLAADWEADVAIRNRGRAKETLTCWPSQCGTGIASMKACALNARVLEWTATWWVSFCDNPIAIPIDMLRQEVQQ